MSKVSSNLLSHLKRVPADADVDVIIELNNDKPSFGLTLSRKEKINSLQKSFSQNVKPVQHFIKQVGGEIVDQVWLNQSLHVRLPVHCLDQLAQIREIAIVDIPHVLTRD